MQTVVDKAASSDPSRFVWFRRAAALVLLSCLVGFGVSGSVVAAKRTVSIGNITFDEGYGNDFSGCSLVLQRSKASTVHIMVSDLESGKMRLDGKIRTLKGNDQKNWTGAGYTVTFRGKTKPVGEEGFEAAGTLVVKKGTASTTLKAYLSGGC